MTSLNVGEGEVDLIMWLQQRIFYTFTELDT